MDRFVVRNLLKNLSRLIHGGRDIDEFLQITSIPTLLAFSRLEAQLQTKLTNVEEMKDKDFLRLWMEDEAMRGGSGGKGGGLFGGLFGVK